MINSTGSNADFASMVESSETKLPSTSPPSLSPQSPSKMTYRDYHDIFHGQGSGSDSPSVPSGERVTVQHLETHNVLQNNRCNLNSNYNANTNNNSDNNNYNESAFTEMGSEARNEDEDDSNPGIAAESVQSKNNNNINNKNINDNINDDSNDNINNNNNNNINAASDAEMEKNVNNNIINNNSDTSAIIKPIKRGEPAAVAPMVPDDGLSPSTYRTEDQENAYRRIEDVHNYAKLTRYGDPFSNGSSNSSSMRDEEDSDEDIDEGYVNDMIIAAQKATTNYYRKRVQSDGAIAKLRSQTQLFCSGGAAVGAGAKRGQGAANRDTLDLDEAEEAHDVDVETVESGGGAEGGVRSTGSRGTVSAGGQPEHHARRPMNAFLIFCKRHRAIVKDRYKTFENRAITKILGEWWASLEAPEKTFFTNLAQQNKDAFFSANPNFQWYKLPAPPLRTLSTRTPPSCGGSHDADDDFAPFVRATPTTPPALSSRSSSNFFKLADEAQMGELSSLMIDNNRQHRALQHALGETSKFLSTVHMPGHGGADQLAPSPLQEPASGKRRLHSGASLSSNSSEDDVVPKKTARTCKGKIYQELMNSGQIAAVTKKPVRNAAAANSRGCVNAPPNMEYNGIGRQSASAIGGGTGIPPLFGAAPLTAKRTVSESEGTGHHYALAHFDLEEKIKELPALSLDAYLQRKRNTKKKKKFTGKKRIANSGGSSTSAAVGGVGAGKNSAVRSPPSVASMASREQHAATASVPHQQQAAGGAGGAVASVAVGSQKRKARKESITRRDVSAIENEIASLMPVNGHYYFDDDTSSPPPPPPSQLSPSAASVGARAAENTSSTSDLLILAEVAANRTELDN